jgi:hypothetical protein
MIVVQIVGVVVEVVVELEQGELGGGEGSALDG